MSSLFYTILPLLPLAIWTALIGWSPNRTEGEVLLRVPIPLLARLKMLWIPITAGGVLLVGGILLGGASLWLVIGLLIVYVLVLAIPVSYTLTTQGIRAGKGYFRRWTEFAGVRRSPVGAVLQGGPRARSYPIFLSGNREDDDFVLTLRTLVRDSYKGKTVDADQLRSSVSQSAGETSSTSSISH